MCVCGSCVLKKAKRFEEIKELIYSLFDVKKEVDEGVDVVFIAF